MIIYVDADACPVQKEIFAIAKQFNLKVTLVKSYDHFSMEALPDFVDVVYVDKGADMADYKIIQKINSGDFVITQDYGLASLALGKKCHAMHHKGFMYTKHNIDKLLADRHHGQLMRRAGAKTKGPKAFTQEDRDHFALKFYDILSKICEKEA